MRIFPTIFSLCLMAPCCVAQAQAPEQAPPRPAASTLSHPKGATQAVDARGFIHRWLVLEPAPVAPRLTDLSWLQTKHQVLCARLLSCMRAAFEKRALRGLRGQQQLDELVSPGFQCGKFSMD